jgi:hypothetical protein
VVDSSFRLVGDILKLSKSFLDVLKNISAISEQMYFVEGNVQSILSEGGTVFASIKSDVSFEKPFAINKLPKFLSVLSMFEEPNIRINQKDLLITSDTDKKVVSYQFTNPDFIYYEKNPKKFDKMVPDITFNLKYEDFASFYKLGLVLDSQDMIFEGDGQAVYLKATNSNNNGDNVNVFIADTNQTFKAVMRFDALNLMKNDYKVGISNKGAIRFSSDNVTYFTVADRKKSSLGV